MFVKQANRATLVETFEEAIKVEKNSLTFEPKRNKKIDTFPRKRTEKYNPDKDKAFDVEQLQNVIIELTNEVVGLEKNSNASTSRGFFRNQFMKNSTSIKTNSPLDVAVNEEIFNTIHVVLSIPEYSSNQTDFYQ